jgi:hypothetical protein
MTPKLSREETARAMATCDENWTDWDATLTEASTPFPGTQRPSGG